MYNTESRKNPPRIERPVLAVDVVLFVVAQNRLRALLQIRESPPFAGAPALPGVAVRVEETLADAARRALLEKTGGGADPDAVFYDQLAAFDGLYRDPRGRTVSVAYMGLTREAPKATGGVSWEPADALGEKNLPFDHGTIVKTAVDRLRGKLRYTNIAKAFLPKTFRIEALHGVYEAVLGREVNLTNFRNKLLKIRMIEQVKVLNDAVGKKGGRPPHLYRFTADDIEATDRDLL
jgi:8-oxo-dGTP diphosphatase